MSFQSTLRVTGQLLAASIGLLAAWHGLEGTQYRSLLMRMMGKPAIPMNLGIRVLIVSTGMFLTVVSLLLAFGLVQ